MLNDFSSFKPVGLKCEYKVNPTGIDIKKPLLSWLTGYDGKNSYQLAFRVIISTSNNNVWDSGKIVSSESSLLLNNYQLKSNTSYNWKIMLWNEKNEASQWSDDAFFSTGLFEQSEWRAKWIRHNYSPVKDDFIRFVAKEDKWVWHSLKNNDERFKSIILKKSFEVQDVISAKMIITADEKFHLWINDKFISESDDKIFSWARPKHIAIKEFIKEGKNEIKIRGTNSYVDEPGVLLRMIIETSSGIILIKTGDGEWKSSFEDEDN
ncbi:MAG: hypothetical protein ACM3O3_02335, partial [Syntrophothermus sp.]